MVPLSFILTESINLINVATVGLQCISCCSGVMWYILGFYWRFSKAGRTCSGDQLTRTVGSSDADWEAGVEALRQSEGYQTKGGRFMNIFLYFVLIVLLAACALGSIFAAVTCVKSGEEANLAREGEEASLADADQQEKEKAKA